MVRKGGKGGADIWVRRSPVSWHECKAESCGVLHRVAWNHVASRSMQPPLNSSASRECRCGVAQLGVALLASEACWCQPSGNLIRVQRSFIAAWATEEAPNFWFSTCEARASMTAARSTSAWMRGGPCRAAKSCSAACSEPRKPPRRYRRGQREQRWCNDRLQALCTSEDSHRGWSEQLCRTYDCDCGDDGRDCRATAVPVYMLTLAPGFDRGSLRSWIGKGVACARFSQRLLLVFLASVL
jgi:hypothetical protein